MIKLSSKNLKISIYFSRKNTGAVRFFANSFPSTPGIWLSDIAENPPDAVIECSRAVAIKYAQVLDFLKRETNFTIYVDEKEGSIVVADSSDGLPYFLVYQVRDGDLQSCLLPTEVRKFFAIKEAGKKEHVHNFQYYKTYKNRGERGYRCTFFEVIEKFHCSKCGEIKEVTVGSQSFNQSEMDNLPTWVRCHFYNK